MPVQLADLAGGALWGAVGILSALLGAKSSGQGRHVDVSMCEGSLAFLIPDLGNYDASGVPPKRGGEHLNGGSASYGVYRTKDGRFLSVGALEPKFWTAFNQTIGRPVDLSELIAPDQETIRAEIQAKIGEKTRDEWEQAFVGVDTCVEPVLSPDEIARHPQHVARKMFFQIGDLQQTRTPFGSAEGHRPPPQIGQHSDEILVEAGYSAAEIATLHNAKVTR
jgi:crotonobetainyl-CoA:carnitine CoA-transferase CaiB-like acyl-CoA transferase